MESRGVGGVITGLGRLGQANTTHSLLKSHAGAYESAGELHRLQIQVLQYQPHVSCVQESKSVGAVVMSSCRALLQQIPASDITQIFGRGGADIDVKLPLVYTDSKSLLLLIPVLSAIDVPF